MIWNAAHADGLIIEPFSLPPDLAARGLTGQVLASRMLDRLTEMQNETVSVRAPQSFANDWGNDLKVEIPETGISFGEAYRYLKGWLGHETHLSGEVVRIDSGIALTARVSGDSGFTVAGTEADLDSPVEKAVENVYGRTQPYRFAVYLAQHNRADEALSLLKHLATEGAREDRPWGYIGWSNVLLRSSATPEMSPRVLEHALALQPDNPLALNNFAAYEATRSRPEIARWYDKQLQSVLNRGGQRLISADGTAFFREQSEAREAAETGDFGKAAQDTKDAIALPNGVNGSQSSLSNILAQYETSEHDMAAAQASLADPVPVAGSQRLSLLSGISVVMAIDSEIGNWIGNVSQANKLTPLLQKYPGTGFLSLTTTVPLTAYAEARLGNIATAETEIAATPADCYDCLIARARIAEIQGQHARADWWFGRAVSSNPSTPFAYADWGQALLERGRPDEAIAKFKLANQKGPHFADPLEEWGEALMAKTRSDLALAKFEEANKYAPNWGRLPLKWGEALRYAGKPEEAQKQFARTVGLDLTAADKGELDRMMSAHGAI